MKGYQAMLMPGGFRVSGPTGLAEHCRATLPLPRC